MSDYVGNRRGTEGSQSVPVGSPAGQNKPPVSIDSPTQPSEPIADKKRITILVLKRAGCVGLRNDREKWLRCCGQRIILFHF
jgi:hypothetical protein